MSIGRAIMTSDPAERDALVNYEVLKFVVQSKIFDDITKRVVDIRRAVLVRLLEPASKDDDRELVRVSFLFNGDTWDEHKVKLLRSADERNLRVEVIDGRHYTVKGTLRKRKK